MDRMREDTIAFSVVIVTYNHEAFLAEAIDSALEQKFNKRLEIVIAIDKSSDKTAEVAKAYQRKYPDIIKLLEHKERLGMYGNFKSAFAACSGKYIAILEGDDYWTDNRKLQTQYDFFEANEYCVLSAGLCSTIQNGIKQSKEVSLPFLFRGKAFCKEDLVYGNRLATLTTAFRASAFNSMEFEKLHHAPHLDWGIYLSLDYAEHGFIYRFNRNFGNYRVHEGGIYSMVGSEKRNVNFLKTIYALFFLQLEDQQKNYLKHLFANYSYTHNVYELLAHKPYKNFYNPGLLIYASRNKLRKEYLKLLSGLVFNKNFSNSVRKGLIRFHFELIRQTKYSKSIYFNIKLIPFLAVVFVEKVKNIFSIYSRIKSNRKIVISDHRIE